MNGEQFPGLQLDQIEHVFVNQVGLVDEHDYVLYANLTGEDQVLLKISHLRKKKMNF